MRLRKKKRKLNLIAKMPVIDIIIYAVVKVFTRIAMSKMSPKGIPEESGASAGQHFPLAALEALTVDESLRNE